MSYESDREWAQRYDDRLQILAMKALRISQLASFDDDAHKATDFHFLWHTVGAARQLNIAARVRRAHYGERFPHDVTFRYTRPSGAVTEWHKIVRDGYADFAVYAIAADDTTDQVRSHAVLNLALLREHFHHAGKQMRTNRDGTTFLVFDVRRLAECADCVGLVHDQRGHDPETSAPLLKPAPSRRMTRTWQDQPLPGF